MVNPLLNIYQPKTLRYTNYNRAGVFMFDPNQLYLLLDYTDDQALFDDLEKLMPGFKKQGFKIIKNPADDRFFKIAKQENATSYFAVYQDADRKVKVFYKNEDKIIYEELAMCDGNRDRNMHCLATNPICRMKLPNRKITYLGNKDCFFHNNHLRVILPYTDNEKMFADIAKIFCGFDKKDFKIQVFRHEKGSWSMYLDRLVDGADSTESISVDKYKLDEIEVGHRIGRMIRDDTEKYNRMTQNGARTIKEYVAQLDDGEASVKLVKRYDVVTKKFFVAIYLTRKTEDGGDYMFYYYVPLESFFPKDKADFDLE